MAPSSPYDGHMLAKRLYYRCDLDDDSCRAWAEWGRWVFAVVVVILCIALFAIWGCISSRRRRQHGQQPFYGTGWMAPPKYPGPPGQGPGTYQPGPPPYVPPPPHQQASYTGTSFNTNEGYYGNHEGIQMTPQPPTNTYQPAAHGANQDYYAPPEGPPPGRK